MSLMRLLTAGKCLDGLREHTLRYKMTDPRAMPKFGQVKKAGGSRPPSAESQKSDEPDALSEKNIQAACIGERSDGVRTTVEGTRVEEKRECLPEPSNRQELRNGAPHVVSGPGPISNTLRVGAVVAALKAWLSNRRRLPRRRVVRSNASPVQGELALERVQVVRNDLSDADLEVVPMRARAAEASEAPAFRPKQIEPAVPAWGQAAIELAGTGQS